MTEKLYYIDSHQSEFTACVIACEKAGDRYAVTLDRTAFFPEGGGQAGDTGYIGGLRVLDTQEKDGDVLHYTDAPADVGAVCACRIDREQRFRRMQNHSGEHIVSGLVHERFGYNNIGFHMGNEFVTIDFDGDLSADELRGIEREANRRIAENRRILTSFPDAETLSTLEYRSKLELTENVRIVEIEGTDKCACCAPHVHSTAEVGIIKILSSERRRRGGEGVRITMLCGLDAYDYLSRIHDNNAAVSVLLSARREETAPAVERLLREQEKLKARIGELSAAVAQAKAAAIGETDGNLCLFDSVLDEPALREIVNAAVKKCTGIVGIFSGSDADGYRYILGSRSVDLRRAAKALNAAIAGRGGGRPEMIQGSCTAPAETIRAAIEAFVP